MKKLVCVALLLVLTVSACAAFALTTAEKEQMYNETLFSLETWLEGGHDAVELVGIYDTFKELGGYGESKFLAYYADALIQIEDSRFDFMLKFDLQMLSENADFVTYLAESLEGTLGTIDELSAYAEARQLEYEGKTNEAAGRYRTCISFYDSADRYERIAMDEYSGHYEKGIELFATGELIEAYHELSLANGWDDSDEIVAFIVKELGYDPAICNDNHQYTETVVQAATCVDKGEIRVTCTVCGKTETKTTKIDSKNHIGETEVKNAKKATCGKKGYSGDTYCLACEKKISAGKDIKATGKHKWEDATYDAPKTCTVCGKTDGKPLTRVKVGDYITFGHYPQTSKGNDNTPIEWLVLDVDQNQNKALVISKYALDCQPYNSSYTAVTWETCTLRKWLKNEFINKAFTPREQKAILTTTVDNSKGQGYWDTNGGKNTKDKVFLLSYAEAWKYFKNNGARKCAPTDYAAKQGMATNSNNKADGKPAGIWCLRSPGYNQLNTAIVYSDGSRIYYGVYFTCGVRPALWVNLLSDIF